LKSVKHVLIGPAIWISGLIYIAYPYWGEYGLGGLSLTPVAMLHTGAAFLMLAFLVMHLYLALTTSERLFGNLKGMITGYEEEVGEETSP